MNHSLKILIVDGESHFRETTKILLTQNDYSVFEAGTVKEAFEQFNRHKPDLVLLDLYLPDSSGFTFLNEIREVSDTRVLIVSGKYNDNDKIRAFSLKADDFISKPIYDDEFLARIENAFNHNRIISNHTLIETERRNEFNSKIFNITENKEYVNEQEIQLFKYCKNCDSDMQCFRYVYENNNNRKLLKLLKFLSNYYYKYECNIDFIVEHLPIPYYDLNYLILKYFSCSPKQLIENLRLDCALRLLIIDKSIIEIAIICGYNGLRPFQKAFKKRFTYNPTQLKGLIINDSIGNNSTLSTMLKKLWLVNKT